MSVRVAGDAIYLEGRCPVDDAEPLFAAIREHPGLPVDIHTAERFHLAVAQVLLALGPELRGMPADPFLARFVLPAGSGAPGTS
jgi:hypothetical protein